MIRKFIFQCRWNSIVLNTVIKTNQLFFSRSDWLFLIPDCSLAEVDGNRSLCKNALSKFDTLMFHHDQRVSPIKAAKDVEWILQKQLAKVALMTKKESLLKRKMPVVLSQLPNTSNFPDGICPEKKASGVEITRVTPFHQAHLCEEVHVSLWVIVNTCGHRSCRHLSQTSKYCSKPS